ncbi:Protein sfk1 [Madurella mycetomatis]|uniref:Protein sfk1 n=1 Tax=Madurella mycetomatis TaxID=100816 RepID=A0A175VUH4_9PEZI|nr:Protein sfk1 [Madurella mycetomatis]
MFRLSYWVFPIIGGVVWLGTLLGLLLYWLLDADRAHYASMVETQHIAYISDVGAQELKPLFVTGCVVTSVLLSLSFAADRWLRHKGRLAPNTTRGEKVLSGLAIVFAIVGTVGLILLSVFDTLRYQRQHTVFLLLFIVGYVLSAIFICWEYQRLGMRYREYRVLRISFYIKLAFVIIEILLAIAFIACTFTRRYNPGAVLEWVIAFIFSAYVFSFYVDLYPAAANKQQLQVSAGNGGGLKMRLTRGREPQQRNGMGGFAAASEMEDGGSNGTLTTMPDGVASFEAPHVSRGRRSGSRSRVMASNF